MAAFTPLLDLLANVPDPRRGEGQLYKLPHVLLFAILSAVTGGSSYRGVETFINVHRGGLNAAFGLKWRRAPAHTSIRYILKRLDPADVETVFRRHAALLEAARATPGQGSIALDGKTPRGKWASNSVGQPWGEHLMRAPIMVPRSLFLVSRFFRGRGRGEGAVAARRPVVRRFVRPKPVRNGGTSPLPLVGRVGVGDHEIGACDHDAIGRLFLA